MQLDRFFSQAGDRFQFTRDQASSFAKQIADDFNPIHDPDAKRFCVPGDLLFAVALSKLGLHQKLHVRFSDMVTDGVELAFAAGDGSVTNIQDDNGKIYLSVDAAGEKTDSADTIEHLTREYVAFSGKTFPHVLVPLWKQQSVMVNPARPLVIYESMSIDLDDLAFTEPTLEFSGSSLEVTGKRGTVTLEYLFKEGTRVLGRGQKRMLLSGLKPYDQAAIDDLIRFYEDRKTTLG